MAARTGPLVPPRRRAAERVGEHGGRGDAATLNEKHRIRVAAFEEALSRVSAWLAEVAHQAAEELRGERLEQARAGRSPGPQAGPAQDVDPVGAGRTREHEKTRAG